MNGFRPFLLIFALSGASLAAPAASAPCWAAAPRASARAAARGAPTRFRSAPFFGSWRARAAIRKVGARKELEQVTVRELAYVPELSAYTAIMSGKWLDQEQTYRVGIPVVSRGRWMPRALDWRNAVLLDASETVTARTVEVATTGASHVRRGRLEALRSIDFMLHHVEMPPVLRNLVFDVVVEAMLRGHTDEFAARTGHAQHTGGYVKLEDAETRNLYVRFLSTERRAYGVELDGSADFGGVLLAAQPHPTMFGAWILSVTGQPATPGWLANVRSSPLVEKLRAPADHPDLGNRNFYHVGSKGELTDSFDGPQSEVDHHRSLHP